jgi:PEP-CTERM motif
MFKHLIAAAAALAMSTAAMAGTSSFDSGAEFASTQGAAGWSYGYYATAGDASSFTQFASFDSASTPQWWEEVQVQAPWTLMWDTGGHPSNFGGADHWAVRRWTSGAAGELNLGIQFQAENFGTTKVHVIVDGSEIYSADSSASFQHWSPNAASLINAGSVVDFAINANGSDGGDATRFTAQGMVVSPVTPVPEPESVLMMLAGLGALAVKARRKALRA